MKTREAILDLGARFGIEAPHVEHVARLSLDLFDGFFPLEGLRKEDRNLLFAAAYLHDVAYSVDPENHVVEAARILAENRIEGFAPGEWRSVIAIALLHKRDWRGMLDHETFPKLGEKESERVQKLAAILRIADGLDHGHIQDAEILYCKRGKQADKVGVVCGWYSGNIPWAEGKADLWEAVFKRSFRFKGKIEQGKMLFKNVVFSGDSAVGAACKLLYSQYDVMRDQVPGMLEGRDPECLHDYRVAMRRFRAALRMFKPLLRETTVQELDDRLAELSDLLGPVRDAHAALQLFQSLTPEGNPFPQIKRSLKTAATKADRTLAEILGSDSFRQTVQLANRFLRVELPVLERESPGPSYRDFARERLDPLMEKILGQDASGLEKGDAARMHEVRKLCRRGRYQAEFAEPVLGRETRRAAKRLAVVAGALGDVRDARALLRRFDRPEVAALIEAREREAWERFHAGWKKLGGK